MFVCGVDHGSANTECHALLTCENIITQQCITSWPSHPSYSVNGSVRDGHRCWGSLLCPQYTRCKPASVCSLQR